MIFVLIGAFLVVALCLIISFRNQKNERAQWERMRKYYLSLGSTRESIHELYDRVVVDKCDKDKTIEMVSELKKDIDIYWYEELGLTDDPVE